MTAEFVKNIKPELEVLYELDHKRSIQEQKIKSILIEAQSKEQIDMEEFIISLNLIKK